MLTTAEVTNIQPQILYLAFYTQKELTLTMCRVQEYYESAFLELNSVHFTWETFLDVCTTPDGEFNYFSFWSGFNVPSTAFLAFFSASPAYQYSTRELALYDTINAHVNIDEPFYVIATCVDQDAVLDHEIAHAMYSVDAKYRQAATALVEGLDAALRAQFSEVLSKLGYGANVITDEINAYLSTTSAEDLKHRFKVDAWSAGQPFRELFSAHR